MTSCLRFRDEDNRRFVIRLLLRHLAFLNQHLALVHLLLIIFLDVAVLARVQPCPREEVEVVRELLLEALQVYAQGVLPSDVVHAKEMIDSLVRLHQTQLFRMDAEVLPLDVPLQVLRVRSHISPLLCEQFAIHG